jgi:prepilin-type N-terminal cleavage/methylation domain-containing protein
MNQASKALKPQEGPRPGRRPRRGFTLVELMAVMVIIAIILGFILNAAMGALRSAEERATQSLINKLEMGLNDRLDALLQNRPDANWAHFYMASVYTAAGQQIPSPPAPLSPPPAQPLPPPPFPRAQVFALYDFVKAELPDVFFRQNDGLYPLNFAGLPFPGTTILANDSNNYGNSILPLGNSVLGPYPQLAGTFPYGGFGDGNVSNPAGTGIFGASYYAAAGIYKNLGYLPAGYDGVDNNGDGFIDDYAEGVNIPPAYSQPNTAVVQQVTANLQAHTHITARAEMLYAVLVEGQGPLGSVFNRDDFTDKEVRDTDGDGLPEFVDAWGQPLQFFRWPFLYHSDTQRGQPIIDDPNGVPWLIPPYAPAHIPPYTAVDGVFSPREQDPLDLNQQLLAPMWWSSASNTNYPPALQLAGTATSVNASFGAQAFEYFFHRLTEPLVHSGATGLYWDRGASYPYRRSFFSKFLVVSSGPGKQPGVFLYSDAAMQSFSNAIQASHALIANENNALPFSVGNRPNEDLGDFTVAETVPLGAVPVTYSYDPTYPSSYELREAAKDDISNQNLSSTEGGGAP